MALFHIIAIFHVLIQNLHSAIITTPTSSNGTNQYFDTISSTNNYQFDTIICSTPNCHIICDEPGGCFKTNINASSSNTLTITCNQNSACESLTILDNGAPQTIFNLYCSDHDQACAEAMINIPTTDTIDIICNYTSTSSQNGVCTNLTLNAIQSTSVITECNGDYSCNGVHFIVNDSNSVKLIANGVSSAQLMTIYAQNITNDLNISCGAQSCDRLKINVETMKGALNLECNDYFSCNQIIVEAMNMGERYVS